MSKVALVFITMLYSSSKGILLQVINRESICLNDTAVFTCTNEVGQPILWDISSGSRGIYSRSFTHGNPTGRKLNRTIGSSTIVAELEFANSTFITSTLTIIGVTYIKGNTVACNSKEIVLDRTVTDHTKSIAPPSALKLNLSSDAILISWNSSSNYYYIEVSFDEFMTDWTTNKPSIMLNLTNTTQNVSISICPGHYSNFTIGPCLFYETSQNLKNNIYTVYLQGIWEVSCTNEFLIENVTCSEDGTWENASECSDTVSTASENMVNHNLSTTMQAEESTSPSSIRMIENMKQNVTNESASKPDVSSNIILISSIVPVGIVLPFLSILIIIVPSKLWWTRHKKLKHNDTAPVQTINEDMTYEHLSNSQFSTNRNNCARPFHHVEMIECGDGNYSSLLHKKPSICPSDEYATIQSNTLAKPRRIDTSQYDSVAIPSKQNAMHLRPGISLPQINQMEYAEIKTCDHCGHVRPFIDHKVGYTIICSDTYKSDESLNLDTLLMQLRPIAHNFKLFGSVAGISPTSLNQIVSKSASSYDGMMEVCDLWLEKCRKEQVPPTWHAVAEILALIGQNKLSDDILQVYATGQLPIQVDMKSVAPVTKLQDFSHITLSTAPPLPPQRRENHEETTKIDLKETQSDKMSDDEVPPPVPPYYPEQFDPGTDATDIPENLHANEVIHLDTTSPVLSKKLDHNSWEGTSAPVKHMEVASPIIISFGSQGIPGTILKKHDLEKLSQTDETMD